MSNLILQVLIQHMGMIKTVCILLFLFGWLFFPGVAHSFTIAPKPLFNIFITYIITIVTLCLDIFGSLIDNFQIIILDEKIIYNYIFTLTVKIATLIFIYSAMLVFIT